MHTDIRYGAGGGAYGESSLDGCSFGGGSYQEALEGLAFYGDRLDIWGSSYLYNTGQTFLVDITIHFP